MWRFCNKNKTSFKEKLDLSETDFRVAITLDVPRAGDDGDDTTTQDNNDVNIDNNLLRWSLWILSLFSHPDIIILPWNQGNLSLFQTNTKLNSSASRQATLHLHVSYPLEYPDIAPHLSIVFPSSSSRNPHRHLTVSTDSVNLLAGLESTIQENLGIAMIFTLISTLKETAETLIIDRLAAEQSLRDDARRKLDEEANRRFVGEKVTRESFRRWRDAFRTEMALLQKEADERDRLDGGGGGGGGPGPPGSGSGSGPAGKKDEKRLTGKELWERGMVGREIDDPPPPYVQYQDQVDPITASNNTTTISRQS